VTPQATRRLVAVAALVAGAFLALALLPIGLTGPIGARLGPLLWQSFGLGALGAPLLGLILGLAGLDRLPRLDMKRAAILVLGGAILVPYVIGVLGRVDQAAFLPPPSSWAWPARLSGWLPGFLARTALDTIGLAGGLLAGFITLTAVTLGTLAWHPLQRLEGGAAAPAAPGRRETVETEPAPEVPRARAARKPKPRDVPEPEEDEPEPEPPPPVSQDDVLPPLTLLAEPSRAHEAEDEAELDRLGVLLLETLRTFKVDGTLAGRTTGPSVSQFEVVPAAGVKAGRIVALADDLAITMRTPSLRVAPLPDRGAVGVEIPNPHSRVVTLREILESDAWARACTAATLPVVLGRDVEGKPVIGDLARMPHLLVAGATGSGKSVAINTIITSLVYRYPKKLLWFVMIDPKMVELSIYGSGPRAAGGLPHLRKEVITDNRDAASALNWAVQEMNRRYKLLQTNGARNIGDFNRKVRDGKPLRNPPDGRPTLTSIAQGGDGAPAGEAEWREEYGEGELPMIVVIVDELADLMMTVQGEIEKPLAMLAQKARAIGIHLILATQRPSVNVLTGLIKANFPSRMAFRVASKVDSRTILDQNGAEALLGNGDMLWIPPGRSEPVRIQGAYIGTEETERLIHWYQHRGEISAAEGRPDIVEEGRVTGSEGEPGDGGADDGQRDALFRNAAELCIQHQGGSTSLLQRRLGIGYGRAARIIDQLHDAGILGPPNGSKPREVMVALGQLEEYL
jgi:S-DNA-T family DNA segregation ATPase FtsK/SpoIIIE